MSFVYPYFLWALLTLAIPIIIHLFYFRRYKTVFFTNVQFLKEVKEQTAARSRLKHLLALLMRLGALAALVFAFAMPFIPAAQQKGAEGARDVSVYFDNSFSMAAESEDLRLLEKARQRATEIIAAYDNEDRIQILTSDFEGRDQRLLSKEEALNRIQEIQASPNSRDYSKILAKQKNALNAGKNPNKEVYYISDFQKNTHDLSTHNDSSFKLNLIPLLSAQRRNVSVDSAWFVSPVVTLNQPNALIVKIKNHSEVEMPALRVSLTLDGQQRPEGSVAIAPNGVYYDTVNVTVLKTGWHSAQINVTDFPIEFDNDYYFSFYVAEKISVLEVFETRPSPVLQAAFPPNQYFSLVSQPLTQLQYNEFANYNLIILNEVKNLPSGLASELVTYINNGGNVLLLPAAQADLASYNQFSNSLNANGWGSWQTQTREVNFINYEDFIFNDVFETRKDNLKLPNSSANYSIQRKASSVETVLLRYRDGSSFVCKHLVGKGHFFLVASPLSGDFSNLAQSGEIFIPMLYRMALSVGTIKKIAYTIGQDNNIETTARVSGSEMVYKIGNDAGEFIPEQRTLASRVVLGVNNQIKTAGIYQLFYQKGENLETLGFNFNRKESELSFFSLEDIEKMVGEKAFIVEGSAAKDFSSLVATQNKGRPLWKWFLILSLVFLAAETIVLRLIKG